MAVIAGQDINESSLPGARTATSPRSRTRRTVDRWWPETAAFLDTGRHNAKSEGINRVIKLVARNAFGFSAATDTVRHHPTSPRTPLPRLISKTRKST